MELRRRLGMVFQRPIPFPLSIYDNVAFGLQQHYRLSKSETADWVEEALRGAALWDEVKDSLHRPGTSLSGGQQQRLCIARAIVVKPEVLLMDEPCSAIDPVATAKVEELILELKSKYTIAIVTHNMQQAARISDFTAFFYRGHILDFGATGDIFNKYSLLEDIPRKEHLDALLNLDGSPGPRYHEEASSTDDFSRYRQSLGLKENLLPPCKWQKNSLSLISKTKASSNLRRCWRVWV